MLSVVLKNLSILKKFLFINSVGFIIIGLGTIFYLKTVQPNLIKNKIANHIQIIDNTIDHIQRLNVNFNENDIRKFLFSTRFLFQNLDRVIFFDKNFNLIGDTDTLDLDPRSFPKKSDIVEQETLNDENKANKITIKKEKKSKKIYLSEILINYSNSKDFGLPYTYTEETYNLFLLTTIKNVNLNGENVGFLAISENANEIRTAINERKSFIIRTAFFVVIVILIFSLVLNRYFLKPIKNLVSYTKIIKERSQLMDIAYREDTEIEDRTIDSHVKRIRKKFKTIDKNFSAIETRYGSGYRWNVS